MAEHTLPEQIADQLRRDILRGTLAPGAQVKERDTAAERGVSRTPMREAIRILAKEGLVVLRPARSPIVAKPSLREVSDNIEVLTALELLSGSLACARATDRQIADVADVQARFERSYDMLDRIDVFELDMEFHLAIVRAANNPVLEETHRAILSRLWRARYLSATRKSSRDRVIGQHRAIAASLRDRDAEGVQAHMQSHLEHLVLNVQEYFETGGEDLPPEKPSEPAA